ncbi:MAG TPA: glycosyltransferase family 39 protein, partial [Candidatus Thermoplasmatota archaeon]|nr:glycosyltransferase family 39 protein [Candidatus Thermoplasmatota archaeon]
TDERDAGRTPTVGRPIEVPAPPAAAAADPVPPTQTSPAAPGPTILAAPRPERAHWAYYVALGAVAALALYLRLRDPLASTIIGAEDPYLHMERTYQLIQGDWVRDYPIGFMLLLAPFALMGPDVFCDVARFGPAFLGTVGVVLTFFLCRPYMHPSGALTASLLLGVIPEHIRRTDLLFPTAVDLAILPFFFLVVMKLAEGRRWAVPTLLGLTLGLLIVHPWVVALMVPPLLLFGAVELLRRRERKAVVATGGIAGAVCVAGLFTMFRQWQPAALFNDTIVPKVVAIANQPALLLDLPVYVNFEWMLTWPVMVLGGVGVVLAALRHTRFNLLILFWTLLLLPLVLVDWFDVWYLPHRTVVYLALGIAILGGVTMSEIARALEATPAKTRIPVLAGAVALVAIVMTPLALATEPWYRLYDGDDEQAWAALEERDTALVMTGSWQARAGYRAMTGRDATYWPDFFNDENVRNVELRKHPDLVVLMDRHVDPNVVRDTSFLAQPDWVILGQWGDVTAYQRSA